MSDQEETTVDAVKGAVWKWVLGITGVIVTTLLTASLTFMVSVGQDAHSALSVNETQAQELLLLRSEIAALRVEIKNRTDDRYTSLEATRDLAYIERRLAQIESQIEKHIQNRSAHHNPEKPDDRS